MTDYLSSFFKKYASRQKAQIFLAVILFLIILLHAANLRIQELYRSQLSPIISDRNNQEIAIIQNKKGYYVRELKDVPAYFAEKLIIKEDRFFYYHPGINIFSIIRDFVEYIRSGKLKGSSTITQQLIKNILSNENERTLKNKITESLYALGLDLFTSKKEILRMYLNSSYFGNQIQGLTEASNYYYGLSPEALSNEQTIKILATLNNPSYQYPGTKSNTAIISQLAEKLNVPIETVSSSIIFPQRQRRAKTYFELSGLGLRCQENCRSTIDQPLTERIRKILYDHLESPFFEGVENGAIVIIGLKPGDNDNELLAIVGSPDPNSYQHGKQINMAIEPRPIGSTIKPFIYAKAFEKGARPYTLVVDQEYQYTIGTGFPFYPKNYDGKYRGAVTIHEALSNSLNVPTVKTLEFIGLDTFNDFLETILGFQPRQPLNNYQLGIALGGLEMDTLTLASYFTAFPNRGILKPLRLADSSLIKPPMGKIPNGPTSIVPAPYAELINIILSDRERSVDQFGLKGNLNLTQANYAVKTGTSYDYHDSWTIGYTPDFLVAVWLGNSDNTPIRQISGQSGAGKIWHDVMELMFETPYNQKTPLSRKFIKEYIDSGNIEYGLDGDDYETARTLIENPQLITEPHDNDVFLFRPEMVIHLRSHKPAFWTINNQLLQDKKSSEISWKPERDGKYNIEAHIESLKESISIEIQNSEKLNQNY